MPAVMELGGSVVTNSWLVRPAATVIALLGMLNCRRDEIERDGLGEVVGQAHERGDAAGDRGRDLPSSGPTPVASDAVTTVWLSLVSRLLYWSFFVDDRLRREGHARRGR